MNRSKKKAQKRREEYNKAIKHKMESAADLADKYSKEYEMSSKSAKNSRRRIMTTAQRKLIYVVGITLFQTVMLLAVVALVFLPFRRNLKHTWQSYFAEKAPDYSSLVLSDDFVGSNNADTPVHFTEVEQPDVNSYYAEISSDDLDSSIYFGLSDSALLEGVCQISTTSLPGLGKPIMLYGYNSTHLCGIENIAVGDVVKITTNYGVYQYSVKKTGTFDSSSKPPYDLEADKEELIICTDYPFGRYKTEFRETYYVIAQKVSGPEIDY